MDNKEKQQKQKDQELRLKKNLSNIKYKLMVLSGKGGVGKTTVSVSLAYSLAKKGKKVGLLDVDIHGPNTAKMMGVQEQLLNSSDSGITPYEVLPELKLVSLALIQQAKNGPVIWRGPLKMIVIKQFLADVNWGKLDYLIIDSPPGTGDEPLSICQLIPDINGIVIVTTPQEVAVLDAKKSIDFAKKLNAPVTGIIENMSAFKCPHCGNRIELFGENGGKKTAETQNIRFLGKIPFDSEIVKLCDMGKPIISYNNKSEYSKKISSVTDSIQDITEKISENIK